MHHPRSELRAIGQSVDLVAVVPPGHDPGILPRLLGRAPGGGHELRTAGELLSVVTQPPVGLITKPEIQQKVGTGGGLAVVIH